MKKRILSLVLVLAMIIGLLPSVALAAGSVIENRIQIGDFIKFGHFKERPLLWQVVDIEGEKIKLFSTDIIFNGPIDADVKMKASAQVAQGESNWHTSDIRQYLNSEATVVSYKGELPNYGELPGFLTNFSNEERKLIKEITHKSLVHYNINGVDKEGGETYARDRFFEDINFDLDEYHNLAYINTTEKVFLPDMLDLREMNENGITPKRYYYNEYSNSFVSGDSLGYFTRTPIYQIMGMSTRYYGMYYCGGLNRYGTIATSKTGIRPMCYITSNSNQKIKGEGTLEFPYEFCFDNSEDDEKPTDSLKVVSQYPKTKGVFADDKLKVSMTFNYDVESVQAGISFDEDNNTVIHGNFSIARQIEESDSWEFETVYSLQDGDNAETDVTIDGKTVTIDVSDAELISGETYYILMDNGVISFKETEEQIGFAGTQWTFTVSGVSSGTFRYKASYGITEYPYTYDDNWFLGDSTNYNHELAKMSLKAAIAAYGTGSNEDGSEYIQELMSDKLGFSNLDVYYPEPKRNSIGYAIGSKKIPSENGEGTQSLILVAIRGGKYGAEWGGNFTIGTGGLSDGLAGDIHEGFSRAAEQVENGLESYIKWQKEDGELSDDCIVWVVGYSRAAATANLLAKRLDDGNIEGLGRDNVFAYCFECPQNSRAKNLTSEKYNNIMNIVNPLDFVTMVAMDEWKYGRYGQTFYLPYEEGVDGYNDLKLQMIQEYINIIKSGKEGGDAFAATEQVPGQKDMTMGAMNWLADEFGSPEEYAALYQESLVEIIEAFQTGEWKPISSTAAATLLLIKLSFMLKDALELPKEPKDLVDKLIGLEDDVNAIMTAELFLFGLNERGSFKETHITYSHYPELCLAWMELLAADEVVFVDKKYRKVFVNCPVDVEVYDSDNVLVGHVIDKVVQEIEGGVSIYIDDNEQIVVSLPMAEGYRINTTATGSGTVTYTVSEHNIDTNNSERVVSYPLVEIEEGDVLVGTIENLDETDVAEYNLTHNETELSASIDQSGEKVKEYTVSCIIDGNGKVSGGGKAVSGEYRKLIATPEENAEFLGWYNGDKLISTELEYRFCVLENVELTAKFTKTESPNNGTGGGLAAGGDTSNKGADNFNNTQADDTEETKNTRFTDLSGYAWAEDAINSLADAGIIKGTSATTYSPSANIIRADFAALLVRLFKLTSANEENFADVAVSDYFASELAIARNTGIVNGIGDNKFAPRNNITRQDMMVMIYRAMTSLGIELAPAGENIAGDFDMVSDYAKEAVSVLMTNGIITGKSGNIDPTAYTIRAEVAVMLFRVLGFIK